MSKAQTKGEIKAFLASKPGWITLSTISASGYPHSVPLGYFMDGENVVMGVKDRTVKVFNIELNPRVSVMLESGRSGKDIRGVMIQGDATVYRDSGDVLHYMRLAATLRGVAADDLPTKARPGAAYIVVRPVKTISWMPEA